MIIKKAFVFLSLLSVTLLNAQQEASNFMAFGDIPTEVNPDLYQKLQNADDTITRLAYLDTIARVFLKNDFADSLETYAFTLKKSARQLSNSKDKASFYTARAWYYQGTANREMGFLEEATAAFIKGIEKTPKNKPMHDHLQLGLIETYLLKGKPEKAKSILDDFSIPLKTPELNLSLEAVKADYYFQLKKAKKAYQFYKKGLHYPKIDSFPKLKLRLQLGLAKINLKSGRLKKALPDFKKLKRESLRQNFYQLYIEAVIGEGRVYQKQKNYQMAEAALNSAYVNAVSWNRLELQKKINRALVKLYVTKKDYKNAYSLMTQYASINYRIASKQNAQQVRELEYKYETVKKEREIQELQKTKLKKQAEIDHQKTIKKAFLIGFLVVLIPIVLLLIVYYQKLQTQSELNTQQDTLNQQEMQAVLQAQELKLARTAMAAQHDERQRIAQELHDSIGGDLAAIKLKMNGLSPQNKLSTELMTQLDKTYKQVREISHSLVPEEFKEQEFSHLVGEYIRHLNEEQAVNIHFDAYPKQDINHLDEKIQVSLFNIIKELVTNAFKHAKASEIQVQLSFIAEDSSIALLYEDDGVGFNPSKNTKGIGLKNIDKRVADLNGTLSINSQLNQGTVISINLSKHTV